MVARNLVKTVSQCFGNGEQKLRKGGIYMQNKNRLFKAIAVVLFFGLFLMNCSYDNTDSQLSSSSDLQLSSSSESPLASSSSSLPSSSSSLLPNASSSSWQDTYLGYGYDVINSSYINRGDVKMLYPILDQEKMISDGLVASGSIGIQEFETFVGNSLTKFYEERNKNIGLGLSASVPFKSVLFSGKYETEFSVKLNENRTDEHSYLRGRSYHYTHHEYIGKGRATAEKLVEYLSEGFAADLRSKTAAQILDRYGSHIFIQYYKGGVMEYNYAYYGTKLTNSTEMSNALKASLSIKIGVSASVSDNSKKDGEELENNSIFHSYTYGGALVNISSVEQIESNYTTWLNSIETKSDICGIGKFDESFIPVWELAAASGKTELAKELEREFLDRAIKQGKNMETMKSVVISKSFTSSTTYSFDKGVPAIIEVYALGAGGGGQGGNRSYWWNPINIFQGGRNDIGTGGSGGGGAAAYMKFSVEESVAFNITVGKGGSGGGGHYSDWNDTWESGNPGDRGGNTSVTVGSRTLTAEGGGGAGGGGQNQDGGGGGKDESTSKPANLLDFVSKSGMNGDDGQHMADLRSLNRGGRAAIIEKGSEKTFGGGTGATNGIAAQTGGGGMGGYNDDQSGTTGGNGQVVIVVTYFEK